MKISKTIKEEILQVYETWLHSYLNGDVATYDSYFDNDYHFIGSTNNEEFLNRKDTTKFFADTAEQLAGKCDLRNESRTLEQFGELVIITHFFDAWFLNENEYNYYERFRFSSALRKNSDGWRFIYQHFSTPDSNTDEGETIGFDKISEENTELRDAIKRRTIELEAKNRDLEIEGALGRIRAQAVAMKESADLLDIVVTMRTEFTKLGHQAHYFWHMMWLPEKYEKAMTSGDGTRIGFVMELPKHIHGDIPLIANWEKSDEPVVIYPMDTEAAIAYVDKMVSLGDFKQLDPQAPTHDDLRHIKGLTFIMARTSHGEIGYSLPGVVKNPPAEDLDILVRFAGAFDLAHRRFLDLKKSEKQARDVQIELALEKVRSRTMAMQRSDELAEASFILDEQVRGLGMKTWGCAFNIFEENQSKEWFGNEAGVLNTYTVPRDGIFETYYQKHHEGESLFIKEFAGDECTAHYEYMSALPVLGDVLKKLKESNDGFPTYQMDHVAYFKYGYLLFITREPVPEAHDIFKRFAKVFEQTYTRFLDLQKAEKQARESQIETALEKVRSQSLAMQNSEELKDVIKQVYEQLVNLDIKIDHAGFVVDYIPRGDWNFWIADKQTIPSKITHPFFDSVWANQYNEAKENGSDLFTTHLGFEEKNKFYEELLKHVPDLSEEAKNFYMTCPGLGASTVLFDDIGLYIENFSGTLYSDEENEVLMRFGKVFQQTYTRFLDLQKAEAQAQEAKIQLALERVRARIMAMHKSEELSETAAEMFQQMSDLSVTPERLNICFFHEEERTIEVWPTDEGGLATNMQLTASLDEPTTIFKAFTAWKEKKNSIIIDLHGEELKEWVAYVRETTGLTIKEETLDEHRIHTMVFFSHGTLMTTSSQPIPNKSLQLLERFAHVFDQAYVRFLDLQKAEALAREAQIETALEKVRSRSLAMQSPDELIEVAELLREEMGDLGVEELETSSIYIHDDESEKTHCWFTIKDTNKPGMNISDQMTIDLQDTWVGREMSDFYRSTQKRTSIPMQGQQRIEWMRYCEEKSDLFTTGAFYGDAIPDRSYHLYKFSNGYIGAASPGEISDESWDLLKRATAVFSFAYTRFLDLKKAKEQAREAQIELSLERIRAKTMAMQSSEELAEVAFALFEQLRGLGGNLWGTGFGLCEKDSNKDSFWFANENGVFPPVSIPNTTDPAHQKLFEGWKVGKDFVATNASGEDLKSHYDYMLSLPEVKPFFQKILDEGLSLLEWQQWNAAYFKHGYLLIITLEPYPDSDVLIRFARVFDQTYTRFLDLQKAEVQAREAQIEVALERVRSKAMAMHSSDDLAQTVDVFFHEIKSLNVSPRRCGVTLINKESTLANVALTSATDNGEDVKLIGQLDLSGHAVFDEVYRHWQIQEEYHPILKGEELRDYYQFMNPQLEYPIFPDDNVQFGHYFSFEEGVVFTWTDQELSNEDLEIFRKFKSVLSLTYRRYLDLKEAEALARESQIELALERIRALVTSMKESSDLFDIVVGMRTEFISLGHQADYFWHMRWLPDVYEMSMTSDDGHRLGMVINVPKFVHDQIPGLAEWEKGDDPIYVLALDPIGAWNYIENMNIHGHYQLADPNAPTREDIEHMGGITFVIARTTHGEIGYSLPGVIPNPSKEALDTLARFAGVFDLAYKRFEDLQTAEKDLIEIKAAKAKAEKALIDLKSAQDQLIQAEKMASLGELTAGIAHEIQNPLNFVNNFSEVSNELIDETVEEVEAVKTRHALSQQQDSSQDKESLTEITDLLSDVKSNLEKITRHGKRADAIVKGMLAHSRSGKGEKTPTDLNALAEEYLKLSYHGIRAKDKSFNADFKTEFDPNLQKVNAVPQDIGRVLLNLINNAFQAVNERSKREEPEYKPIVSVKTELTANGQQLIAISDNGPGIPDNIKEKIFQPFFTTKPTGQGTGLGLSLSYDIVKAHGGELTCESKEGKGTEFIVKLPQ